MDVTLSAGELVSSTFLLILLHFTFTPAPTRSQSFTVSPSCSQNPCVNGGTCVTIADNDQLPSTFVCLCPSGFGGQTCAIALCPSVNPCLNGGRCVSRFQQSIVCNCNNTGFSGDRCQNEINECHSSPCLNGGLCVDGVNRYSCLCQPGFSGLNCEIEPNQCSSQPCLNGGLCLDLFDTFLCVCIGTQHWGRQCQTPYANFTGSGGGGQVSTPAGGQVTVEPQQLPPTTAGTSRTTPSSVECDNNLAPLRCYVRFVAKMYNYETEVTKTGNYDKYCSNYATAMDCIKYFDDGCPIRNSRTMYYVRIARKNMRQYTNGLVNNVCRNYIN